MVTTRRKKVRSFPLRSIVGLVLCLASVPCVLAQSTTPAAQQQSQDDKQTNQAQSGGQAGPAQLTPHYPGIPPTGPRLETTIGPAIVRFYGTVLLNFSTSDQEVVG